MRHHQPRHPLAPRAAAGSPLRTAIAASLAAVLATGALAAPAQAQPATSRTPNLEGTWTTPGGTAFFAFLHRFQVVGGSKVVNYPTFHLSTGVLDWLSLGANYASQAAPNLSLDNELEVFSAQRLLDEEAGAPLSLSLREAWHTNFSSPDAELSLARRLGPVTVLGTARVLGRYKGGASPRTSAGLGASWALTPHLRLAADAAYPLHNPTPVAGEPPLIWGAGLQMAVPYSPHTLSLQVSNAASATMHGAATGSSDLRYGFDFTVPFAGPARWLDIFRPAIAVAPPAPAAATPEPGEPAEDNRARAREAARVFFASRCAGCHGAQGTGGFGPDLRQVELKGDTFIANRIANGSPKGMPGFAGQIAGAEFAALLAYVKGL